MRKFLVIAVLAGLAWLFVVQKRNEASKPPKTAAKVVTTSSKPAAQTPVASPRPVSEHNWMKNSLDRTNDVKRQVVQQRKADGTR
jgi:cytoskeletal protein RodZ